MKTKIFTFIVIAVAALFTGCLQKSVYPFYAEKDIYFDEKLLGQWRKDGKQEGESTTWIFEKGPGRNSYKLILSEKEEKMVFDARLFRLGEQRMIDIYSQSREEFDIPAHMLLRVRNVGESLKLQGLSAKWVGDRVGQHPNEIAHVRAPHPDHPNDPSKGEIALTATTGRLQKFIVDHLNDEGVWDDLDDLRKAK